MPPRQTAAAAAREKAQKAKERAEKDKASKEKAASDKAIKDKEDEMHRREAAIKKKEEAFTARLALIKEQEAKNGNLARLEEQVHQIQEMLTSHQVTTTTSARRPTGKKRTREVEELSDDEDEPPTDFESDPDDKDPELAWLRGLPGGSVGAAQYDLQPFDWEKCPPTETMRKIATTCSESSLAPWAKDEMSLAAEVLQDRVRLILARHEAQGTQITQDAESWQWAMEAVSLALRIKHYPKPTRQIVECLVRKRNDKEESSLYGVARRKATWSRVVQDVEKTLLKEKNATHPPNPRTPQNNNNNSNWNPGGRGGGYQRGGLRGGRGAKK